MSQRIHLGLPVEDLSASAEFYRVLFGRDPEKVEPDYVNFRLDEPPIHLALTEGVPAVSGTTHYGIELPSHDALAQWKQRADSAGLSHRVEEDAACCYARADKLWFEDPNGYPWEIWVRTGKADKLVSDDKQCCA